ncbi:MAG: hypothetical protein K0S01_1581 [Herbinix sp.]|jgi:hypothetical protein|nr:hypothetical protein [Herbinix sp.]
MGLNNKSLHVITGLIIVLGIVASLTGLLYINDGQAYDFVNQYGDIVKIYGNGLYANDSFFMAPIFRGADLTIIVIAIPMLILALFMDRKKKTVKSRFFLISVIAVFTYYSASIAFGVTYNILHLVYIAFFSVSLFGLIIAIGSLDREKLKERLTGALPYKGFHIFLTLSGVVLIVAWIPDILQSLIAGRPLALIEIYTTSVTNVLDMAIIGPVALISIYQLKKRSGLGYILLGILFTVCITIGVMVPIQSAFQIAAGIDIPLPVLITKVASFVLLSLFALYLEISLFRSIK